MTILNGAGDEGSPGDDRASWGELEDDVGRVRKVEFGIHVDQVVGEKGREWILKGLDGLGMGGSAKEGGANFDCRFEKGGE